MILTQLTSDDVLDAAYDWLGTRLMAHQIAQRSPAHAAFGV